MSKKKITYFGEVDNQENDFYEGNVILNNKDVELDLDFGNYEGKPAEWAEELKELLSIPATITMPYGIT